MMQMMLILSLLAFMLTKILIPPLAQLLASGGALRKELSRS